MPITSSERSDSGRVRFGARSGDPLTIHSKDFRAAETTRYLCATAWLDPGYRDRLLHFLTQNRYRSIGTSCGVDMPTVVKHCCAAKEKGRNRDLALGSVIASALVTVIILVAIYGYGSAESFGYLYLALVTLAGGLTLLIHTWSVRYGFVLRKLTRNSFDPDSVGAPHDPGMRLILQRLVDEQNGNLIVHSGFTPFLGCGTNISGWSFALDASKPKQDLLPAEVRPFQLADLYDEVCADIRTLKIGNLTIEDKLCLNGEDLEESTRFLSSQMAQPATSVDEDFVESVVNNPSQQLRHYKQIRVVNWNGELVLTIFLRFARPGRNLFIEVNYCLLTPVSEGFRAVDQLSPSPLFSDVVGMVTGSLMTGALLAVTWPLVVSARLLGAWTRWEERSKERKLVRRNPAFNRGAGSTIREAASSGNYRRFFQKLDKEMNVKILERVLIDSIVRFLEQHGIDTCDLIERRTTILNSGVIVSGGGSLSTGNLAVGEKATVSQQISKLVRFRTAGAGSSGE